MTGVFESSVSAAGFGRDVAGVTPPSNPDRHGAFLVDVIVELGMADHAAVEAAERIARETGEPIAKSLLERGVLDEKQLARAIAERSGLDHVDLDELDVSMEAAELIGRTVARRYRAVPIAFAEDGSLIVACKDPADSLGISDIEVMTRSEVRCAIAAPSQLDALIERIPAEAPRPDAPIEPPIEPPEDPAPPEPEEPPPPSETPPPSEAPPSESPPPSEAPPQSEAPPTVDGDGDGDLGELSTELRTLLDAARNAEALATTLGGRIERLEGAEQRAERLEQQQDAAAERIAALERELASARERVAELEQRLADVSGATEKLKTANEVLLGLQQILEDSAL